MENWKKKTSKKCNKWYQRISSRRQNRLSSVCPSFSDEFSVAIVRVMSK
jgi:hypothetical protein